MSYTPLDAQRVFGEIHVANWRMLLLKGQHVDKNVSASAVLHQAFSPTKPLECIGEVEMRFDNALCSCLGAAIRLCLWNESF